jgi:hypothetical protein
MAAVHIQIMTYILFMDSIDRPRAVFLLDVLGRCVWCLLVCCCWATLYAAHV